MNNAEGLYKALLVILSVTQGAWMVSWIIGRWTQRQEISNVELGRRLASLEAKPDAVLLDRDIKAAHLRMDHAGREMSNLLSKHQGMEAHMRDVFLPREVAEHVINESQRDREHLWAAVAELKRRNGGGN